MLLAGRVRREVQLEVMAVPLSDYEQRVLNQLEEQLTTQDPTLGAKMVSPPSLRRGRIAMGLALGLAGLAGLIAGMVVGQMWVSMLGFCLMFVGAYWAFSQPKQVASARPTKAGSSRPLRPKLSERFEKRWEERGQG